MKKVYNLRFVRYTQIHTRTTPDRRMIKERKRFLHASQKEIAAAAATTTTEWKDK